VCFALFGQDKKKRGDDFVRRKMGDVENISALALCLWDLREDVYVSSGCTKNAGYALGLTARARACLCTCVGEYKYFYGFGTLFLAQHSTFFNSQS
jgi:hypothetical protein